MFFPDQTLTKNLYHIKDKIVAEYATAPTTGVITVRNNN